MKDIRWDAHTEINNPKIELIIGWLDIISNHFERLQRLKAHKHEWHVYVEHQEILEKAKNLIIEAHNPILARPLIMESLNLTESSASGLIPQAYPHTGLVEDDSQ